MASQINLNCNVSLVERFPANTAVFNTTKYTDCSAGCTFVAEIAPIYAQNFRDDANYMIVTNKIIDREALVTSDTAPLPVVFRVTIIDSDTFYIIQLDIHIIDINDNVPTFIQNGVILQENYSFSIYESQTVNRELRLFQAMDFDEGPNGTSSYVLIDPSDPPYFNLTFQTNAANLPSAVTLRNLFPLDRELNGSFTLTLIAYEGTENPRNDTLYVTVNILDIDDNIVIFTPSEYTSSPFESVPLNTTITKVIAHDEDEGSNAVIEYTIKRVCGKQTESGHCNDITSPFILDSETGELTLSHHLDYETIVEYRVNIEAHNPNVHNGGTSTALVTVIVQDVSDNSPVFNAPSPVTVTAPETPTAMPEFVCSSSLIARDADDLVNTPLNYTIIGNPNFTAEYDGGSVAVCISNLVGVDRETTPFIELTLEAVDNGSPPRSSNVTVIIQVTDINDNSPDFQISSPKILFVPENTAVNHVLYSFNATDRDDGVNAEITYSISPPQQSFAINSTTGDLYSTKPLEFDGKSDEMKSFQFNVIASDSATEPRMTSLQVVVKIVDVNDNAPTLANSVPDFLNIVEGKLVKPSVRFQLRDADSGVNRIVRAIVTSGSNFYTISNGSLIFANIFIFDLIPDVPSVDRETTNQIDLAILFYDQGVPSLNATVTSTIIVEDINDNAPTLNRTNYSIPENVLVGNSIVNLETYFFDQDNGSNGTLDRVVQLSESNLIEVSNKGLLRLRKSLDREMHEVIEVLLQIFDAGTPQLNSTITVYIRLLDVNDNSPTFDHLLYKFSIRENDQGYQNIGQVMARDPDNGRNGTVEYRIMNSTSLFAIDNTTGYISTNEIFDREMQPSYTLIVLASDHGTPPKSTTAIVIVEVIDVNDEQPIFDRQRIEFTISTYTPAGSTIGQVNATDPDENSHLRYSLSGDGANQFRIYDTTGVISTAQAISGDPMDQWTLTVIASDGIFSTTAQVIITVTEPPVNMLTVIVIASSALAISVVIAIALFATFMLYMIYKCRKRKTRILMKQYSTTNWISLNTIKDNY